jgi:hypothetical protein
MLALASNENLPYTVKGIEVTECEVQSHYILFDQQDTLKVGAYTSLLEEYRGPTFLEYLCW